MTGFFPSCIYRLLERSVKGKKIKHFANTLCAKYTIYQKLYALARFLFKETYFF